MFVLFAQAPIEVRTDLGKVVREGPRESLGRQNLLSLIQKTLDLLMLQGLAWASSCAAAWLSLVSRSFARRCARKSSRRC